MEILIQAAQLILSLSLLVILHEAGHFLFAKLFKIRVEKFYLFFNPGFSLFKFRIGETEYGMGWVPFGGYVKISGMIDESMDKEQMAQPPKPYEFRSKPAWQRLLVMVGGVLMNIIAALVIYIGMSFHYGTSYLPTSAAKEGYAYSELAQQIGFRNGDRIVSVDGETYEDFAKLNIALKIGTPDSVVVERAGETVVIPVGERYTARLLKDQEFISLRVPFVVDSVSITGHAAVAGILPGDSLIALDGRPASFMDQVRPYLSGRVGDSVLVSVVRDSAGMPVSRDLPVVVADSGRIGVTIDLPRALAIYPTVSQEYTFWEAIPAGVNRTVDMVVSYIDQLKLIFNVKSEAYKQVGSVISMGSIFAPHWDWYSFWSITAFFSVMLAALNILPIPALDGGHVLFLLYEVITRRKPSDKFMEYAQMFGMVLLMLLIFGALGNDIYRLFTR